jgi:hypothetical protein
MNICEKRKQKNKVKKSQNTKAHCSLSKQLKNSYLRPTKEWVKKIMKSSVLANKSFDVSSPNIPQSVSSTSKRKDYAEVPKNPKPKKKMNNGRLTPSIQLITRKSVNSARSDRIEVANESNSVRQPLQDSRERKKMPNNSIKHEPDFVSVPFVTVINEQGRKSWLDEGTPPIINVSALESLSSSEQATLIDVANKTALLRR